MINRLLPLLLFVILLTLSGCGSTRETNSNEIRQDQSTTRTTTIETKTVPGPDGPMVSESTQTVTIVEHLGNTSTHQKTETISTVQFPAVVDTVAKMIPAVAGATPWTGIIGTVTTGLGLAWAAYKSAQANAEKERADSHKEDSDEAWKKLEAALRKAPQETQHAVPPSSI